MASDEIKERILQRADIIDIIGEVVELKKRGTKYTGLCPFHTEKTPSFVVSEDRGIYKCFGCGEYGDVFTFLMKYRGLTFPEAMEELAKRYGIAIPKKTSKHDAAIKETKHDLAYKAAREAALYYNKLLWTTSGKIALDYFRRRGFTDELINGYMLGYCPDSWDSLYTHLEKLGFTSAAMLDAGLIIEHQEKKSFYDRFRNRAVFPIHEKSGRITGFGARQLDDDKSQPKYLNSPQSLIYDKSRTLYGYYHALNEIRTKNSAILVEGYADVLTLHQAGYRSAVASSGTALTSEQLQSLPRSCRKLFISYDSDNAGKKAAEKALEIALGIGFDVRIASLPEGEDPDSLIKNHGAALYQVYLDESRNFLDFLVDTYKLRGDLDSPTERVESIRKLIGIISKIPDRLQHDEYIGILSARLNLTERQIQNIYKEKIKLESKSSRTEYFQHAKQQPDGTAAGVTGNQDFQAPELSELLPEEKIILQLMLNVSNAGTMLINNYNLSEEEFISNKAKILFSIVFEHYSPGTDVVKTIMNNEELSTEEKNDIINLTLSDIHVSDNWPKYGAELPEVDLNKILKDCIVILKLKHVNNELNELKIKLNSPDENQQLAISKRIKELVTIREGLTKSLNTF